MGLFDFFKKKNGGIEATKLKAPQFKKEPLDCLDELYFKQNHDDMVLIFRTI